MWIVLVPNNRSLWVVVEDKRIAVVDCMAIGCMPSKLLVLKLFFASVDAVHEVPCCS